MQEEKEETLWWNTCFTQELKENDSQMQWKGIHRKNLFFLSNNTCVLKPENSYKQFQAWSDFVAIALSQ